MCCSFLLQKPRTEGTSSTALMDQVTPTSGKPWTGAKGHFRIARLDSSTVNNTTWAGYSCVGCHLKFQQSPPEVSDIIILRSEPDYTRGSPKLAPSKDKPYHLKVDCIRKRHPEFRFPTNTYSDRFLYDTLLDERETEAVNQLIALVGQ